MKVSEAAHLRTQIASDLPLLSGAGGPLKHMCNIKNKSRSHQPATKVARLLSAWRFFFSLLLPRELFSSPEWNSKCPL